MPKCSYNPAHEIVSAYSGPSKLLFFPDGRRLDWKTVCKECNKLRQDWEDQREKEKFTLAEERRRWHLEVAEKNAQRRIEQAARQEQRRQWHEAVAERNREAGLARIARLELELETLRKKYLKNT